MAYVRPLRYMYVVTILDAPKYSETTKKRNPSIHVDTFSVDQIEVFKSLLDESRGS